MMGKRLVLLGCVLAILIGGACGCMFKKTDVKAEMLQYMQDKYDEEFTFLEYSSVSGLFPKSSACYVESANYPGEKIRVGKTCTDEKRNTFKFEDNYVSIIYKQQTTDEVTAAVQDAFGTRAKGQYYHRDLFLSADLNKSSTFQEFTSNVDYPPIYIIVWIDDSIAHNIDDDATILVQSLHDHHIYGFISLYYVKDASVVAQLGNEDAEKQVFDNYQYTQKATISMTDDLSLESIDQSEGKLDHE